MPILGDPGGSKQPGNGGGSSPHASQSISGLIEENISKHVRKRLPAAVSPASQPPETEETGRAPRAEVCAAGPARGSAPILDKKDGNVACDSGTRPRFTRKHYAHRQAIRDRMRLWQAQGRRLYWCTLTSAPGGRDLRRHFQAWKARLERAWDIPRSSIDYVMVDTREGHGVLHFILALPVGCSAWFDYREAGSWWQEIHGARQVKFLPIRKGDSSARRLSHYIVAQYMSDGQGDALGRISGSRLAAALPRWRAALREAIAGWSATAAALGPWTEFENRELWRVGRIALFREFRRCWDALLQGGGCSYGSRAWMVIGGNLVEV